MSNFPPRHSPLSPKATVSLRVALPVLILITAVSGLAAGCGRDAPASATGDQTGQSQAESALSQSALTPKVLVIGIDGVRPDVLAAVETPHLDRLTAAGFLREDAQTGFPTVSGPGWSSLLTGVAPDKHGVTSNDFTGHRYAEFPDFLTRIESVAPTLSTFAVADWLPLVSDDSGGPVIGTGPDRIIVLDGYELGWAQADELSVDSAVQVLMLGNPDALFVYLGNPDETSHQYESIGREYREAIALADAHVGRLIAAIDGRSSAGSEDWLVLVSTDHGRTEDGDHGDASPEESTIFYLASGPSVIPYTGDSPPQIVDVAVTALAHLGIAIDPVWRLDGRVRGIAAGSGAGRR